jgi:hypothetical protein
VGELIPDQERAAQREAEDASFPEPPPDPSEYEDDRPFQPCVSCGTRTRNRWCSLSCMYSEDGPPDG